MKRQIDGRAMRRRREMMGLTIGEMARRCALGEGPFLSMLEEGDIETTSSAVMAAVAQGYGFERAQCVRMIAHWSPSWPKRAFIPGAEEERRGRLRVGTSRPTQKMLREQVEYYPYAVREAMEAKGIDIMEAARRTQVQRERLEEMLAGAKRTVSLRVLMRIAKGLGVGIEELTPEVREEENDDE